MTVHTAGPVGTRFLGAPITRRREDSKFLTGSSVYVADIARPGLLHAAFVRSPHAHAMITGVDTGCCRAADGVVAVLTGEDFAHLPPLPVSWVVPEGRAPAPSGGAPSRSPSSSARRTPRAYGPVS